MRAGWSGRIFAGLCLGLMICAGAFAAIAARSGGASTEFAGRDRIKAEVGKLFRASDFAALDELAARYRDNQERTGSGVYKLSVYYATFHGLAAALDRHDEAGWRRLHAVVANWRAASPYSPSPVIAEAAMLKAHAWVLRPRRFVLEAAVTPQDKFVGTIRQAAAVLDEAKSVASPDPHYYALRAELASALDEAPGPFMDLIEEGLARTPGYLPIHFAGLGFFADEGAASSPEIARRIEAYASTAAARLPGAEGKAVYARLYWHAYSVIWGDDLFRNSRVDWARMRDGIDAVLASFPDPWNRNNFAYLACLKQDRETARRLLDGISGPPLMTVWKAKPILEGCRAWAAM